MSVVTEAVPDPLHLLISRLRASVGPLEQPLVACQVPRGWRRLSAHR
jgi:hypothetical protein